MFSYVEPSLTIKRGDFHDFDLMLFDKVIAYDHLKQKIAIVVNMKTDHLIERYDKAMVDINDIINLIMKQSTTELPKLSKCRNFRAMFQRKNTAQ